MSKIKLMKWSMFIMLMSIMVTGCGGGGGGSSGSSGGTFSITTESANNITQTSVKLNGKINPAGVSSVIYFQWGVNTNYGNIIGYQMVGSGNANLDVFADLTGLSLNTTYNYRIVCNRNGQTVNGLNKTFKTRGVNTSAPVLAAIGNKAVSKNALLTFTISATDADVEDTLIYSSPDLPAGATLNSATGAFSWLTPYLDQNYDVTFVVSDDGFPSYSDSEIITITVGNADRPPLLTSPGDKSVDETQLLTFTLSATDPDVDPIAYSMTPTPQGATLNSNTGLFSWTPTYEQSGIYAVTFTATSNALSNAKKINITVNNINRSPVLTAIGDKNANEGQLLSFSLSASDPDVNAIAYTMIPPIPSAVLNSSTGAFLWTPGFTQAGVYNVTFTATDNGIPALSDSEAITITVQNMPQPPAVSTNSASTVTGGSAVLNGTVNPYELSTIAYFEYGISTTYGITSTNQSAGNGTTEVAITARITGLSPTTTYYFRLVAYSSAGSTNGNSRSFTTTSPPMIAAAVYHNLCIKPDGTLWGWGYNNNGQLGQGNIVTPQYTPVQIGADNSWKVIAAGGAASTAGYSLGIKNDGTLWAWGQNSSGQLGLGNTTSPISVTTQVGSDTNWQTVVAGSTHNLAIKTDGTLWAWGVNTSGQCGLGNITSPISVTTQVSTDTWRAIAAGGLSNNGHSLAIKTDGTLWAWGNNASGQCGLFNTTSPISTMTQVLTQISPETWLAVDASRSSLGASYNFCIKTDGTLWTWGSNAVNFGNCGLGAPGGGGYVSIITPTQVLTPTGATWQAAKLGGTCFSFAMRNDNTLWSCGYNASYNCTGRSSDLGFLGQVGAANDWWSFCTGVYHNIGVKLNNSQWEIWGWGTGSNGALDRGSSSSANSPVKIDINISGDTGDWIRNITQGVTTSPPSRYWHSMVWDGNKGILFGGQDSAYFNDLWWYYPATNTWINNTPATISPSARNSLSMVWDGSKVIMFGGFDGSSPYRNDLWWYYPATNTWSERITQDPAGLPVSRSSHSMVWDGTRVIMFGGWNGSRRNDLWWYDPASGTNGTWTEKIALNTPGSPVSRSDYAMVWDGTKVIMFGGQGPTANLNDLWWYYPVTNTWAQQIPVGGPPVTRYGHTMIWNGTRAILFGGYGVSGKLNDVWSYNPTNNTWTDITSYRGDTPLERYFHTMIWDGTRGIVFGGGSASNRNDLWWYSPQ